jgi:hypothetical protein
VADVPEQPPEPLGAAHRPVGDDEDAGADSSPGSRRREGLEVRQRMTAARPRGRGEVAVDVEEAGARNVPLEVELAAAVDVPQLPATVDEPDGHDASVTPVPPAAYGPRQPSVEDSP